MCKKWTSFLALFLAFAMAITGMPANYAYAVETEPETTTQSEEVLEETLEDEEEILDDEIDTEVIDEELTDDSEELGDEEDGSLLDEEISNEIPEETEVATTSSSWSEWAVLSGGYLTFEPDEDAFEDGTNWTCENRNDEVWDMLWDEDCDLIDVVEENTGVWYREDLEIEFFDLIYDLNGEPVNPADDKKVAVAYNFGTDSFMKRSENILGGTKENPTLVEELTDFYYQVYHIDENKKATLISDDFSKDATKVEFDSISSGSYMVIKVPAEDSEKIFHFNNYDDKTNKCEYVALSNWSGNGIVTFDIKGTNTWNARTERTSCGIVKQPLVCSGGNIEFVGDGSITINTDLNSADYYGETQFNGPTVTINGDIWNGMDVYPGDGEPEGEDIEKYPNSTTYFDDDGNPSETIWYRNIDPILNSGVLNYNPAGYCRTMVVNGGELNAKGKTAGLYQPLFSELKALGGKINVTQTNTVAGSVIQRLCMGNADVSVKGVNGIDVVVGEEGYNKDRNLTVNATGTAVLRTLNWEKGTCDISGKIGVGIANPDEFACQVHASGGEININASTVGVYGTVHLYDAEVNINAGTIGIKEPSTLFPWNTLVDVGDYGVGRINVYGKTQAVSLTRRSAYRTVVYGNLERAFLSAGPSMDALVEVEEGEISTQKCLSVLLGSSTSKKAKLYDPEGKYIKAVLFEAGESIPEPRVNLKKEGYHLKWFYFEEDGYPRYLGEYSRFDDNVDLYSEWAPNSYQLDFVVGSYDVSGGDDVYGEYGSYYVSGGDINPEEKQLVRYGGHTYNERYTYGQWDRFPFLLRIGYTFAGWADKFGNIFNEKDICKITHNTTLYPTWDAAQVNLFLEAGGGKVSTDAETGEFVKVNVPYGSELDLNPETTDVFTNVGKIGYVLVGWKKEGASDDTASMTYQMPNDEEDPSSMDPVTLVAVWEKELTVNAPELKDIDGKTITEDKTLPKNSKLFLSTTVNVNGVETPADNDVVEIYYRTVAGDYKLYTDAIVLGNVALTISAFAVEKGVVEEGATVDDTWVASHVDDIVKLNGGTPIVITKEATDVSDIDERDQAYYLEKESELCNDFWVQGVKSLDYAGKALTQSDIRVYFGNKKLVEKTDYTLSYKNNTNAGVNTAIMTVTFKGNYSGKREYKFTINTLDIADATVQDVSVIETGKKLNPSTKITYELGEKVVTLGTKDFKYGDVISAEDLEGNDIAEEDILVKPGRYEIRITGIGNYDGITSFIYEIGSKAENVLMSKANIKLEYSKVDYVAYENGAEKKPEVTVKDGTKELTGKEISDYDPDNDTDVSFTYEYLNNVEVGTATVLVKGTGNVDEASGKAYIGEKTATFTISGKAMSSAIVKKDITATWEPDDSTFDYQPLNDVYAGALDSLVDEIDDFAVTYKLGKPAKETGIRGIDAESYLELLEDEEDDDELLYDYIYEYVGDTTTAGKVSIKLTGVNGFTGTKTVSYTIKAITLNAQNCTYTIDTEHDYYDSDIDETYFVYDGTQKTPGAIVTDKKLGYMEEGVDYEVLYGENVKAGKNKASVVIKGMGRYSGTVTMKFDIKALDLADVENVTIDDGDDDNDFVNGANIYYEKGGVKPDGFLAFNGEPLVLGTDYTATHKNNSKIGEATVTLKGKGNFTGTYEVKYNIVKQDLDNVGIVATDIVFQDKANICKPKVTLTDLNGKALAQKTDYDANLVYTYNKSTTVKQKVKSGKTTVEKEIIRSAGDLVDLKNDIIPEGTEIRVTVTADENGKYAGSKFYEGSTSTVFRVAGKDISKATVKVKDQVMTGEPIYITKDDITEITINKVPLAPSDYVIMNSTYTKNVGKGKASVTIRGVGNYGGTKVINFNIVAPKAQ